MKWSKKHDRYIVNKEINKNRTNKWRREFDRAILFLFLSTVTVGAITCGFIYFLSNK